MPLFFQQDFGTDTRLGIWQITEEETFFQQTVLPQRNVLHPHKQRQHLAGRYLLKFLFPQFPTDLIRIADTRKPFLQDEAYHFSISHCGDYAAALVSRTKRVGVDIEEVSQKADRLRRKFVSEQEEQVLRIAPDAWLAGDENKEARQSTLIWSCKEAVFKWYGLGSVDFKGHMAIQKQKQISVQAFQTEICFRKEREQLLLLHSFFIPLSSVPEPGAAHPKLVLSYLITD